ncbi:MAG: hypothetical protein HYV52_01405 [Parcubacteria group bacterium]|nr:hypothetical protein [Parcubacteria group bacterium]
MMKEKNKSKTKKISKDSSSKDRYFGIVLEDIDSKFQQIKEGQEVIKKETEEFRRETREELRFLTMGQKVLSDKIEDLKTKLILHEEQNGKDFKVIFEYLSKIDKELEHIQKSDLSRLPILETRVAQLEKKIK